MTRTAYAVHPFVWFRVLPSAASLKHTFLPSLLLSVLPPSCLAGVQKPSARGWSAESYKCQEQQEQKVQVAVAQYGNTRLGERRARARQETWCPASLGSGLLTLPLLHLSCSGPGQATPTCKSLPSASITPGALAPRGKLSAGSSHSLQRSFCWPNMCMVQVLSCAAWRSRPESWGHPHTPGLLNLLHFRDIILTWGRVA